MKPQLQDFAGQVSIVVSSCDAFFDVWRPFAFFFRKFWADCPFPVYLIANELEVRSDFIRPLRVGRDKGWASNMRIVLDRIETPYLFYLQEDYFLNNRVDNAQLARDFSSAFERDSASLCFFDLSGLSETASVRVGDHLVEVPPESQGRTRLQATLWKRDVLRATLRAGETAWEMEALGSERTRQLLMLTYARTEEAPIQYLASAIVRGLWTAEAIAMCEEARLKIEPWFRGTHSPNKFIRRLRRAQTRMRLGGELAKVRGTVIAID